MCGINGIYTFAGQGRLDPDVLRRSRDYMTLRGPDGFGEWLHQSGQVGFGHRRLSIIDLTETGAQPMSSSDGKITVTFNGEIYNYRALRKELEAEGCIFHSQSDTEVLIHLYRRHGTQMFNLLRGMFAFGIWDNERQMLTLARDPYGIKPLYYAEDGKKIEFASSVRALIHGGGISTAIDPAGVVGFQLFGSVPEPFTTFKAVKALPAGSYLTVTAKGATAPQSFFSLAEAYCTAERTNFDPAETQERFRAAMLDSVRAHLVADVPVGAFLSSGVDSGALVGLMRDAGQSDIQTVTLAFEPFRGTERDESPLAQVVADHYGTKHTTRWVDAKEFHQDLPRIVEAMDQPSIDGINTWFVAKATRELGLKVAISGVGGDELLGGYSTFTRLPQLVRSLRYLPKLPGAVTFFGEAAGLARRFGFSVHPKSAGLLAYGHSYAGAHMLQRSIHLPAEMREMLGDHDMLAAGLAQLQPFELVGRALKPEPQTAFGKVATLESSLYMRNQLLRDTDWAGMARSIEIRTPLVDRQLLLDVAPIFARENRPDGKTLLANAPSKPLPDVILNKPKTGFGIPVKDWVLSEIDPAAAKAKDSDRLWSRSWMKHVAKMHNITGEAPEKLAV